MRFFERLQNLGTFFDMDHRSKAVHLPENQLHHEFLREISSPVFSSKEVVHDFEFARWEGAETNVALAEREMWDRWGEITDLQRGRSRLRIHDQGRSS